MKFTEGERVLIRSKQDLENEFGIGYPGFTKMNPDMIEYQLGHEGIVEAILEHSDLPYRVRTPGFGNITEQEDGWYYSAEQLYKIEEDN